MPSGLSYMSAGDTLITTSIHHRLAPAGCWEVMARVAESESWRAAGRDRPQCIVPLPLHPRRYCERGFNQSAEIARHLAPRLGLPVETRLLERGVDTAAQSGLTAEHRARNVQQAFRLRPGCRMPQRVVLLDDVMTTGNTVAAASRVLKAAAVAARCMGCAGPAPRFAGRLLSFQTLLGADFRGQH